MSLLAYANRPGNGMSMPKKFIAYLVTGIGFLLVLLVNGTLPFLTAPTMGQLVWLSGFAGSIANGGLITPYIHNVGWPTPAIVSFGLSGAWPMAVLIRLGLSYVDAYTLVFTLWLGLAYWGARRVAIALGNSSLVATLGATLWLTLPVVWAREPYSMLAIGFALLPTYLLPTLTRNFDPRNPIAYAKDCAVLMLLALLAVFSEGYTFFLFASASLVLLPGKTLLSTWHEASRVIGALLAWLLAIGLAYLCFRAYMGSNTFPAENLELFRSWSLDPVYLVAPPQGQLWLADALHLSTPRDPALLFGDTSVWSTTFLLPMMLLAITALLLARRRSLLLWLALAISLIALYLALGPSLKWNTMRGPEQVQLLYMPENAGVLQLHSSWLFEHVPGLRNMRATYRWVGLLALGCWLVALGALPHIRGRARTWVTGAIILVLTLNLPPLVAQYRFASAQRTMVYQMDKALVEPLQGEVEPGERLAILPWSNDFAANYLAARLDVRAFNVGGDKNYLAARPGWPAALRNSEMDNIDGQVDDRAISLLLRNEADVVMLPFFDTLWDVHTWPSRDPRRVPMQAVLNELRASHLVSIREFPHYAIVRRAPGLASVDALHLVEATTVGCLVPECLSVSAGSRGTGNAVGQLADGYLRSTDQAGYLMFGPYQPMESGKYRLKLYGEAERLAGATVDIVDSTDVILPPTALSKPAPGILFDGEVSLAKPAARLEIRTYVTAEDKIRLRGYRLYRDSCVSPHCLQIREFRKGARVEVGRIAEGWVHTTGQRGFLTFGPYAALKAGKYELEVLGSANAADGVRIEVVSDQGRRVHAQFSLPHAVDGPYLLKQTINVTQDVVDAEVRIWVEPDDELSVRGWRLHPISSDTPQ